MILPSLLIFSQGWGLIDPPLRASNEHLLLPYTILEGVAKAALHCAHRTSTVSSCAFCEQKWHLATLRSLQAFLISPHRLVTGRSSIARVERYKCSLQARSLSLREGGLIGLLLRASNEHLLSVRVARARETNRLPSLHQPNSHRCPFFSSSASASLGPQVPAV